MVSEKQCISKIISDEIIRDPEHATNIVPIGRYENKGVLNIVGETIKESESAESESNFFLRTFCPESIEK